MEFLPSQEATEIIGFRLPRYHELPAIDLYMDQVIVAIESSLRPLFPTGEKPFLTSTMISNYVKQGIVSHPVRKRYTTKHVAYLIVVCLLKQVFTMNQICDLIQVQIDSYPIDEAYDYFCEETEKALREVFTHQE